MSNSKWILPTKYQCIKIIKDQLQQYYIGDYVYQFIEIIFSMSMKLSLFDLY